MCTTRYSLVTVPMRSVCWRSASRMAALWQCGRSISLRPQPLSAATSTRPAPICVTTIRESTWSWATPTPTIPPPVSTRSVPASTSLSTTAPTGRAISSDRSPGISRNSAKTACSSPRTFTAPTGRNTRVGYSIPGPPCRSSSGWRTSSTTSIGECRTPGRRSCGHSTTATAWRLAKRRSRRSIPSNS